MRSYPVSRCVAALTIALCFGLAGAEGWAAPPATVLGHPPTVSLVLTQFPHGANLPDFPLVTLQLEAEQRLRDLGIPLVPRAAKPEPPYLDLSVVVIRQTAGFVVLVQADLKERIGPACAGGAAVEVSTWQHRQWATIPDPDTVSAPTIRRFAGAALHEFANAYASHE